MAVKGNQETTQMVNHPQIKIFNQVLRHICMIIDRLYFFNSTV